MMNPQDQNAISSESPRFMKVKRVRTFDQPHHPHQLLEGEVELQPATARGHKQVHTEKPGKKTTIIHSLISRLKNVERPHQIYSQDDPSSKKIETQAGTQSDIKRGMKKKCAHNNVYQQNSHYFSHNPIKNDSFLRVEANRFWIDTKKQKKQNVHELREENLILKGKMNELIIENERLKLRFRKYMEEIGQRVCSKEKQIKMKEQILVEREKLINQRYDEIGMAKASKKIQEIADSYFSKKIHTLIINKEVEHIVFPMENIQLSKALHQIKQLKLDKLQLQKKYNHNLNQYRKKKEDEIDKMKKGFTNNLKYYKDLLLKVSLKSAPEVKKYQEDTFQTVILQTSSADQS